MRPTSDQARIAVQLLRATAAAVIKAQILGLINETSIFMTLIKAPYFAEPWGISVSTPIPFHPDPSIQAQATDYLTVRIVSRIRSDYC